VVAFIALMGFDFLHASANAKWSIWQLILSICLFMLKGKIIWAIALPMAASNAFGGWLGQNWPLRRKRLYPNIFLVVVVATLARFADVFFN
jgi:uncharacterized membrane protein YfcA